MLNSDVRDGFVGLLFLAGEPPPPWGAIQVILDCDLGVNLARAQGYDSAGALAILLLERPECLGVVALTPSGNGVHIYVVQNSALSASAATRVDVTREAVLFHDVRVLEIPTQIGDVPTEAIVREFIRARREPSLR